MSSIRSVTRQVKRNCNVSDARFWGFYSPCGLLLRLRDLYRFERNLRPWDPIDDFTIRGWIDRRESLWEELEQADIMPLVIDGKSFDPFDSAAINRAIQDSGYHYSAGFGNSMKPQFLLAKVATRYVDDDITVVITEREAARDLSSSPAMTLGETVTVRKDTVRFYLYDRYEEMRSGRCSDALRRAFAEYGLSSGAAEGLTLQAFRRRFNRMVDAELEIFIYHEIGGASQRGLLGKWWNGLVMSLPYSRAEFFLRAVADILSDTCSSGPLAVITREKKTASLNLYVALLRGYRKEIFKGIENAYREFIRAGDWTLIEKARVDGYKAAVAVIQQLKEMSSRGTLSAESIEETFIQSSCKSRSLPVP
jgi:hypothetical protein